MTHDPQDHATRATLRALDQQRADTLADALRPVAAPVAPSLDLDAIVALLEDGGTICQCGESIAQWECECGELTCNDCGSPYDPSGPHHGHSREELPRFGKEHGAALVAEVRRLRMELHGAQHALAEASRGRAAASLRAADAEHLATVAMRDGLAECERLRLMARIARALRCVTLARVEAEASDQLTAATADAVLAERERDDWKSIAERREVEGTALASRLRADKAANRLRAEAAEQECERLRAIVEGRTTPPTDAEITAHAEAHGVWVVTPEGWAPHYVSQELTARRFAEQAREPLVPSVTWRPLDAEGRPCAWPTTEGCESRGGE